MANRQPSWQDKARKGYDSAAQPAPGEQVYPTSDADESVPPKTKPSANGPQASRRPKDPEPPPSVETFTAAQLAAMELPLPRWAVYEVVPEGLTILAGKPK